MPRVRINGVVWCKAEDDILKRAVQKYGESRWQLVASFVIGKTVEQCKKRWASGLNPKLKETELDRRIWNGSPALQIGTCMNTGVKFGKKLDDVLWTAVWYSISEKTIKVAGANSNFVSAQRRKDERFQLERRMEVANRLRKTQRILRKIRSRRTQINNRCGEYSFEAQINSSFTDSTSTEDRTAEWVEKNSCFADPRTTEDRMTQWIDQHLESTYTDGEDMRTRAKVVVLPVPQYRFDELHAFRNEPRRPGFEHNRNYYY